MGSHADFDTFHFEPRQPEMNDTDNFDLSPIKRLKCKSSKNIKQMEKERRLIDTDENFRTKFASDELKRKLTTGKRFMDQILYITETSLLLILKKQQRR